MDRYVIYLMAYVYITRTLELVLAKLFFIIANRISKIAPGLKG